MILEGVNQMKTFEAISKDEVALKLIAELQAKNYSTLDISQAMDFISTKKIVESLKGKVHLTIVDKNKYQCFECAYASTANYFCPKDQDGKRLCSSNMHWEHLPTYECCK
jgi:hypothetical protein